jgi:hypothetical protein
MQLAKESWHDHTNTSALATSTTTPANKQGALVMTTEDPALFAQRLQYSKSSNFPLEFVVNERTRYKEPAMPNNINKLPMTFSLVPCWPFKCNSTHTTSMAIVVRIFMPCSLISFEKDVA